MLVGSISANRDVLWQPLTYIFIYSSVNRSMILGRGSTLADLTDPFQMWPCLIILGVVRPIAWACGRPPLPFHHISGDCLVSMEAFSYARPLTSGPCNLHFLYAYSILKSKSSFLIPPNSSGSMTQYFCCAPAPRRIGKTVLKIFKSAE